MNRRTRIRTKVSSARGTAMKLVLPRLTSPVSAACSIFFAFQVGCGMCERKAAVFEHMCGIYVWHPRAFDCNSSFIFNFESQRPFQRHACLRFRFDPRSSVSVCASRCTRPPPNIDCMHLGVCLVSCVYTLSVDVCCTHVSMECLRFF